jgi:CRP/FNR family transcriptional activator FtrB
MLTLRPSVTRSRRTAGIGIAEIRSVRLFAELPETGQQALARAAWLERVPARAVVIEEDAACEALYALIDGTAEVLSGVEDQETVIDIVEAGSVLLLASAIAGLPYVASVRTLSPARVLAVPAAVIRELFDGDRAFARSVAGELSRSSFRMLLDLKSLKVRKSIERLADWLIEASARTNGNGEFRLPFGKRTLASRLGMTPECLSRSLRTLADHGVRVRGREVTVADRAALAAFAGPESVIGEQ